MSLYHLKNNIAIKKASSIAKFEDLGRIQLSKFFFYVCLAPSSPCELKIYFEDSHPSGRRSFHYKLNAVMNLILDIPSLFRRGLGRGL
ncbi:MAG TPA: hypothetical protein DCD99_04600 [Acinetobacter schindleri]|nr:hypothetical protein [Acinetobacter schindleri]